MMKFWSLFTGIGGFDLGFERAGMTSVLYSEVDKYKVSVMQRHYPDLPNIGDVRHANATQIIQQYGRPDLICGGSPCQDLSIAGRRAGLDGERSGHAGPDANDNEIRAYIERGEWKKKS